jgi:hypothetical protein
VDGEKWMVDGGRILEGLGGVNLSDALLNAMVKGASLLKALVFRWSFLVSR